MTAAAANSWLAANLPRSAALEGLLRPLGIAMTGTTYTRTTSPTTPTIWHHGSYTSAMHYRPKTYEQLPSRIVLQESRERYNYNERISNPTVCNPVVPHGLGLQGLTFHGCTKATNCGFNVTLHMHRLHWRTSKSKPPPLSGCPIASDVARLAGKGGLWTILLANDPELWM
ncbi:hypothetical protein BKA70DRAFT_1240820 [Coprinopsis sp. MPI-PUGE-AT-0042]|nr:hypothetical protein BKA70DRAFT_1240820 [Coprinopsis sp. MPI-PUGE-AT-0042]